MSESKQTLRCDFCGKTQNWVKKLIAAEKVNICDECIELCAGMSKEREDEKARRKMRERNSGPAEAPDRDGANAGKAVLYCSFCGKTNHEVENLIAGPTVFICNECVDLCTTLV